MVRNFAEENALSSELEHYVGVVQRRYLHFVIAMFVGWLLVWTASWVLPARYKSGTLILVQQPTMPKDYVTPNVTDNLQERLQSITQQILSRTRLLQIIDQLNLYSGGRITFTPDEKVERMRHDIDIELVRDNHSGQITAFNVYYSTRDPHTAQKVTSQLTNLFINENLQVRQHQSEDTTKFLEAQMEAARQNLATQESNIRDFKGQHTAELPSQLGSNLQILGGLQSQLQSEEDALNSANQQHVYWQTLANQYETVQSPSADHNGSQMGLPTIDQELEKLKTQLADLDSRYTERHPDVRKLKDQIAQTERVRDELLAGHKNKVISATPAANDTKSAGSGTDLLHSSPMVQLQSQLLANQIEIKNRQQTVAELKSKISDYQGRLNEEPVREQQLADLTRGYDQSKANYDELLKKKNDSAMATSMELLQQGERFRVVDPPSLPLKAEFPNRLKFCGMGLGAGLALGVCVVGAFEILDDRLYGAKELKQLLNVPVISEIPVIRSSSDQRIAKRKLWLTLATVALVIGTILGGSAVSYFRG